MSETADSPRTPAPVAVLGLGPMGRALAGAFLDAGHPTTVWNRTPGRAGELVDRGAVEAASVDEAVSPGGLVVVCVIDYDAVHAIVDPAVDALRSATLLSLTADTPARARATAAWAAEHGVAYLDGSIMSPVPTIGTAAAVTLYSGPTETWVEHRATLAALGGSATHLGTDPGLAATHDVALLDLFWTTMSGYVHALALARAQGVSAATLAPYARGIVGLMDGLVPALADDLDAGRFPGTVSSLASAYAGMNHVAHAAEEVGLDTSVLRAAAATAGRGIDEGHGTDGFVRLAELLSRSAVTARSG